MRKRAGQPAKKSGTTSLDQDPEWLAPVQQRLTAWYAEAQRDLPWRANSEPYRILVSEMMLVQTTVTAVIPYFERFLARFPDVRALAEADEADVVKAWEGLGYYRRARQLHAAARIIVEQYGGTMPEDPAAVRALPGVGRYISGAILSFAFDRPEPIVEANSQRSAGAVARDRGRSQVYRDPAANLASGRATGPGGRCRQVQSGADGAWGISLHSARAGLPGLSLTQSCAARGRGLQDRVPVMAPKPRPLAVVEACAVVVQEGKILIVQRGRGGLWEQFWEFPTIHLEGADPAGRSFGENLKLAEGVKRLTGVSIEPGPVTKSLTYSVTNHRVKLSAHLACSSQCARAWRGTRRCPVGRAGRLGDYTCSSATPPPDRLDPTGAGAHRTGPPRRR